MNTCMVFDIQNASRESLLENTECNALVVKYASEHLRLYHYDALFAGNGRDEIWRLQKVTKILRHPHGAEHGDGLWNLPNIHAVDSIRAFVESCPRILKGFDIEPGNHADVMKLQLLQALHIHAALGASQARRRYYIAAPNRFAEALLSEGSARIGTGGIARYWVDVSSESETEIIHSEIICEGYQPGH